jgi:rubrerythrin
MKQNRVFGEPVLDMPESSRRSFLRVAGLVGVGTGLVVGGLGSGIASAASGSGGSGVSDEDILQYALALEYLESTFYDIADKNVSFDDDRTHQIVGAVRDHEDAHVTALKKALGSKAKKKSDYNIKIDDKSASVYSSEKKFLSTAATFEEVGVTAYLGQITHIKDPDILASAASIEGVEARHSAIFYQLTNQKPFQNGPIDMGASMDKVLGEVKSYIEPKSS